MLEEGGVGGAVSPAMCKFPEEFDLLMCGRRYGSLASWCTSNRSSFRYAKQRLIKALKKKKKAINLFLSKYQSTESYSRMDTFKTIDFIRSSNLMKFFSVEIKFSKFSSQLTDLSGSFIV